MESQRRAPDARSRLFVTDLVHAPIVRELVLVVALLAVYKFGRDAARDETRAAVAHAHEIVRVERALDIFNETSVLVLASGAVVTRALNAYSSSRASSSRSRHGCGSSCGTVRPT
jgi:hypothetical protein